MPYNKINKFFYLFSFLCFVSCHSLYFDDEEIFEDYSGLSNINSTVETKRLYENLIDISNIGYLYGHQDCLVYGIGWSNIDNKSDVYDLVNDHPAIFSVDLGNIEYANDYNFFDVSFDHMRSTIIDFYKQGGVISLSWHLGNVISRNDSWDIETKIDIDDLLRSGSGANKKFNNALTHASIFLHSLVYNNELIPILFRPFHEHNQNWFWWGNKHLSAVDYIRLWRYVHSFFTKAKNDNLIYVYSPQIDNNRSIDNYLYGYPGNKYVDILAVDTYHGYQDGVLVNIAKVLKEASEKCKKPWGISEIGVKNYTYPYYWTYYIADQLEGFKPTFVISWRNKDKNWFFGPFLGHPSENDFRDFYKKKQTIFMLDLPQMYK